MDVTETVVSDSIDETNMQLFSFLVLLKAYNPESYLLMSECQRILGPSDPIHGGPPFEERMEPFISYINISGSSPERVSIQPAFEAVEYLADMRISRSNTVKNLLVSLCGNQVQPYIIQFIKDLLTKRELGRKGKEKFSRLIQDILNKENHYNAVSVLKAASNKFRRNPIFAQTISRLYLNVRRGNNNDTKAEIWAKTAIERAPYNSYVADTLGQVYKNRLKRTGNQVEDIFNRAGEAFRAFKDVEEKADREEDPEMEDTAGTVSISSTFNNRGLFGFIQVAEIVFEKLNTVRLCASWKQRFIQSLKMEVEVKFDFFEWYLTYSKPDMKTSEPSYFWKDVALCYEHYATKKAAESTSFPGLLDFLNHGLFTSKGRRARFEEAEKTVSDLEAVRDHLRTTYMANVDDVRAAERYILSNIILSNKMHNCPQLSSAPVEDLQTIIQRFLGTAVGQRSPEFYLLVLLLFWPDEQPQVVQEEDGEEVEQQATEDDGSEDNTWEEEQETRGESAQPSLQLMFDLDLQNQVTFMETAFERAFAKYLRGRYLLPLFFLGKGSGLRKWIHKSRLDAIVEEKVDAELANEQEERMRKKWTRINNMWIDGEVWQVPEIQNILLPVWVELFPTTPQEHEEQKVFVCAGGQKIRATMEAEPDASALSSMLFYVGFTIKGPVVFKVGLNHTSRQHL